MQNDYHVIFTSGKYKGLRIIDAPSHYLQGYAENNTGDDVDAIIRIQKRISVTKSIGKIEVPSYVPELLCITARIKPIERPLNVDPAMFGTFVEYLVKAHLGLSIRDEAEKLLSLYGLLPPPSHLKFEGVHLPVTPRIKFIMASYNKNTPSDICNLSFAHSIMMSNFDETKAANLYFHVKANERYYVEYLNSLRLPIPDPDEQQTCDKISVGCVIGVIDMISNAAKKMI